MLVFPPDSAAARRPDRSCPCSAWPPRQPPSRPPARRPRRCPPAVPRCARALCRPLRCGFTRHGVQNEPQRQHAQDADARQRQHRPGLRLMSSLALNRVLFDTSLAGAPPRPASSAAERSDPQGSGRPENRPHGPRRALRGHHPAPRTARTLWPSKRNRSGAIIEGLLGATPLLPVAEMQRIKGDAVARLRRLAAPVEAIGCGFAPGISHRTR